MSLLRLTQFSIGPNKYRVEAAWENRDLREIATSEFGFEWTGQDQENLRWYLEDYLQHCADPAPKIAARVEERMAQVGEALFTALFESSRTTRNLWARLQPELSETRIEIVASVREATAIPWELLRDPLTQNPLALEALSFVRTQTDATRVIFGPKTRAKKGTGPIRILLVICRPRGNRDVPFRSVASRLIKGMGEAAREAFELDVLRPPTFEQLSQQLREAKRAGKPYHVVHFDGHGDYLAGSEPGDGAAESQARSQQTLAGPRAGSHGYLLFENAGLEANFQLVDGKSLGQLLAETAVPVLVLNACRSAQATAPVAVVQTAAASPEEESADVNTQVRAFGSLAQEVVNEGVAGVVAMRYNVYVVTAAQFVADLYESLAKGWGLGEAVTLGRKQLEAQPLREIIYTPRPLQDWVVPIVYEAVPLTLFPKAARPNEPKITLHAGKTAPSQGQLPPELQKRPDAGFFGRDETLLALDRAFDSQSIVLLHALAGNGKTSTVAEFARWYQLTGGIDGPVLFTSFQHPKTLAQVLNESIGLVFEPLMEQNDIHWLTLDDADRRGVALHLMSRIPILWVWDNVEPVAGFPAGQPPWEGAGEFADFLRAAAGTKARFLLTSRRDERDWLGDLPARIEMPPMPMPERVLLARALAQKHHRRLTGVEEWLPLLRFTAGNPLTISVLVGQALRDGLTTSAEIENFVAKLRAGEQVFDDAEKQGRDSSLGASLSYGFAHGFNEEERQKLALLHFFQGFVDVRALEIMGTPEAEWCLPQVRGLRPEAGIALLDRAAEVGLLTAHGGGTYSIHPALPWFFKNLFEQGTSDPQRATRAFVEAIVALSAFWSRGYDEGNRSLVNALSLEEANLLRARQLALSHGFWDALPNLMNGLVSLYDHCGRREEWRRLVKETLPFIEDPQSHAPLPGREEMWKYVNDIRARAAYEKRQWAEAEGFQLLSVQWSRQQLRAVGQAPLETLDFRREVATRSLAASLNELGLSQREQGKNECFATFQEMVEICEREGDRAMASLGHLNLGIAYLMQPDTGESLTKAESCFQRGLELTPALDGLGRSKFLSELGFIARERFLRARVEKQPAEVVVRYFNDSLKFYLQALSLTPPDAVDGLRVKHNALGVLYTEAGDFERALFHYQETIRLVESQGDLYAAAQTRANIARSLAKANRLADALDYAQSAGRNFQSLGQDAATEFAQTQAMIANIERDLQAQLSAQ